MAHGVLAHNTDRAIAQYWVESGAALITIDPKRCQTVRKLLVKALTATLVKLTTSNDGIDRRDIELRPCL